MRVAKTFFLIIAAAIGTTTNGFSQNYQVGQTAPAFDLPLFGGGRVKPADYSGKILFLNFFGSY